MVLKQFPGSGALLRDNTVTTNAGSNRSRSSSHVDQMRVSATFGQGTPRARLRALWFVWTVGVRISLGAFHVYRDHGGGEDGTSTRVGDLIDVEAS
jgi:hypothetical protein